jgi:hypothetical protein
LALVAGRGRHQSIPQTGDGMTLDTQGNLYLCQPNVNQILVRSPTGVNLGSISIPESPANCTFGGKDMKTLFVTARTSLYAAAWKRQVIASRGTPRPTWISSASFSARPMPRRARAPTIPTRTARTTNWNTSPARILSTRATPADWRQQRRQHGQHFFRAGSGRGFEVQHSPRLGLNASWQPLTNLSISTTNRAAVRQ